MRYLLFLTLFFLSVSGFSQQKKLAATDRSTLTGIALPAGTKEDRRLLSVTSANLLMEDVGAKSGMDLGTAEVFYLPASTQNGNAAGQLNLLLGGTGWTATAVPGDSMYFWLSNAQRQVLAYFQRGKKETSLYLAEAKPRVAVASASKDQGATIPAPNPSDKGTGTEETQPAPRPTDKGTGTATPQPAPGRYQFTTTNFDDGWTAIEEANWVKVEGKGVTVLIHHVMPDMRSFVNDDEGTQFVWNQLIAPRYGQVSNLWVRKRFWTDGLKYYAEANAVQGGRQVFVALYRGGNGERWMEFIAPDKKSFEAVFGQIFQQEGTDWNRLSVMANCNRFAIAPSDLTGTWSGWSGAGVEYVNVYSGLSAGMGHAQSGNEIRFLPNGRYQREYKGVSGSPGGANQYYGEKTEGNAVVSNWELQLTNAFKGQTHVFSAWFEVVQGGRVLHLYRGNIEDMHLYRVKQ